MIEVKNIHKLYGNNKKPLPVLKGIDLKVGEGEFVVIAGPSGAGKSTLLNILGGLDTPSSGKVIFDGEDIYSLSDEELSGKRNRGIGFVFQFYHLLSELTALENALLPGLIKKEQYDKVRNAAMELLVQTGLGDRVNHYPSQLSGGEKQRVAVVRSLINNPKLLLCDEPTGNLDSQSGEGIISLIRKINSQNKMTVVLVTHNMDLARSADKVYHLKDGLLV
ncbi:MAG: Lipoprotein-releasing system ATP-binding protein LolD [Candidatus Omnitrophica bacterium ADurb.Bin205]|nr:MAG: Lipoprotein-releasing system ATP-binding protein LolD [Candidatus Omnitrophica bacterium ADurb.Bin205]